MYPSLRTFVFTLFLIVSSFTSANGAFDVSVHFNGGSDVLYIGEDNTLEVYITNSLPVEGMTLGFEFSNSAGSFELVTPYGSRPTPPSAPYVMEHGDAIDNFVGIGYLHVSVTKLPDSIMFGGADISAGTATDFPVHQSPTLCYSMKIRIPAGLAPAQAAFCVNNIFFPPAAQWLMVCQDGGGTGYTYVPTFQGQENVSASNPDAPAVCFDLVQRPPCDPPQITNCPTASIKVAPFSAAAWNFNYSPVDGDPVNWSVQPLEPVVNAPTIDPDGNFAFAFAGSEGGTIKSFRVIAENDCGLDTCDLTIEQIGISPFVVQLEKTHNTLQGNYEYVSITKVNGSHEIGGFDFLVAYDASALQFTSAQLGADLGPSGCGWEYFTFRYGPQ